MLCDDITFPCDHHCVVTDNARLGKKVTFTKPDNFGKGNNYLSTENPPLFTYTILVLHDLLHLIVRTFCHFLCGSYPSRLTRLKRIYHLGHGSMFYSLKLISCFHSFLLLIPMRCVRVLFFSGPSGCEKLRTCISPVNSTSH